MDGKMTKAKYCAHHWKGNFNLAIWYHCLAINEETRLMNEQKSNYGVLAHRLSLKVKVRAQNAVLTDRYKQVVDYL